LKRIVTETLTHCYEQFPTDLRDECITLFNFAHRQLSRTKPEHIIAQSQELSALPPPLSKNQSLWLAIAAMLLTEKNQWRISVDVRIGFPPNNKLFKKRMKDLLHELQQYEHLRARLEALKMCPPCVYSDSQWQILAALIELLPLLAAQLNLVFR